MGLDRPVLVQYATWLGQALSGDLGRSLRTQEAVSEMLAARIPVTPRSSDQRIARLSKLPEIAILPSPPTASARTGPPCPRSASSAADEPAEAQDSARATAARIAWAGRMERCLRGEPPGRWHRGGP
ncbi:MAG: hypothetical protein ACKOUS_17510 [Alphaproteobacteria bacterium]